MREREREREILLGRYNNSVGLKVKLYTVILFCITFLNVEFGKKTFNIKKWD